MNLDLVLLEVAAQGVTGLAIFRSARGSSWPESAEPVSIRKVRSLGSCSRRSDATETARLSSRPEDFHLQALPEPCMTLSSHTAPDVRPLP